MELLDLLRTIFERVRTDADFISFTEVLLENNVSYYIYFVATGNVNFVMSSDTFVSLKSNRKLLRVNSQSCRALTRDAARRHFSGITTFDNYCAELANAGVFKWVVDLNEKTRHYWSKDNTLKYDSARLIAEIITRGSRYSGGPPLVLFRAAHRLQLRNKMKNWLFYCASTNFSLVNSLYPQDFFRTFKRLRC